MLKTSDQFEASIPHRAATDVQRGQVLLVVVLVMVVILTIGLSVAARNITNLRQSSEEDQSQRAFSAAEAGIEVALRQGSNASGKLHGSSDYITEVRTVEGREFTMNNGKELTKNEGADIWLTNYPTFTERRNANVTIGWGREGASACATAALEITLIYGDQITNPSIRQFAIDPCDDTRAGNRFSSISLSQQEIDDVTYQYSTSIPIVNGLLMRIVPIYHNTILGVASDTAAALPSQGKVIESTGSAGETQRKIVVYQGFPTFPIELFPYTLFTPGI